MSACEHERTRCLECGEALTAISPPTDRPAPGVEVVLFDPWTKWSCVQMCQSAVTDRASAEVHTIETGHETAGETHSSVHYQRKSEGQDRPARDPESPAP